MCNIYIYIIIIIINIIYTQNAETQSVEIIRKIFDFE